MLLEKLQEHKNFTAHEKDVAEYILSHLDQISELSAGELAKASYTSKATVVRLSQKLGLLPRSIKKSGAINCLQTSR